MTKKYYNTQKVHRHTLTGGINNLYELVRFINKITDAKIEHKKAMHRLMPTLVQSKLWDVIEEMGGDRTATIQVKEKDALGEPRLITTYPLTLPTQVRITLAKLSPRYLCFLVNRLDVLERREGITTTQELLQSAILAHTRYHVTKVKPEGVNTIERIEVRRGHRDIRFYFKPNHFIDTVAVHPDWSKVHIRRVNPDKSITRLS